MTITIALRDTTKHNDVGTISALYDRQCVEKYFDFSRKTAASILA